MTTLPTIITVWGANNNLEATARRSVARALQTVPNAHLLGTPTIQLGNMIAFVIWPSMHWCDPPPPIQGCQTRAQALFGFVDSMADEGHITWPADVEDRIEKWLKENIRR